MQLTGKIKLYNVARRCGYIDVEGYGDILFLLQDLPTGYIPPRIGETLIFVLYQQQEKYIAGEIERPEVEPQKGLKEKFKALKHQALMYFYLQPSAKKKQIIIALLSSFILILALLFYWGYQSYKTYQYEKAQQFSLAQQQLIEQQRAELGELPEQILSEQGRRNIDGNIYGEVRDRSEMTTIKIDRMNGQLPVSTGKFKCDGRTQCSEMRSYEEALYFQRHCRGTKLDGNGNGIPCENDTRWVKP